MDQAQELAYQCAIDSAQSDTRLIDWIEANTTLHRQVELLYVVDGYECSVTHDGDVVEGPFPGETVRDALRRAMVAQEQEAAPLKLTMGTKVGYTKMLELLEAYQADQKRRPRRFTQVVN